MVIWSPGKISRMKNKCSISQKNLIVGCDNFLPYSQLDRKAQMNNRQRPF